MAYTMKPLLIRSLSKRFHNSSTESVGSVHGSQSNTDLSSGRPRALNSSDICDFLRLSSLAYLPDNASSFEGTAAVCVETSGPRSSLN